MRQYNIILLHLNRYAEKSHQDQRKAWRDQPAKHLGRMLCVCST